ncbi:MAG: metallophosphoesterase family protein [Eubacteriales bacterium]
MVRIAVLSDFHFGNARSLDMCMPNKGKPIDKDYFAQFISFLEEKKFDIDYLICSGDISDTADLDEFFLAENCINKILDIFNIDIGKFFFSVGNHDKDWSIPIPENASKKNIDFRMNQMYQPIQYDDHIFGKRINDGSKSQTNNPYFQIIEDEKVVVISYNSSFQDSKEESQHHGMITRENLLHLEEELKKFDIENDKIKIFVTHHQLLQFPSPDPEDEIDFSLMQNSGELLCLLSKYKIDLVVHGHTHAPNIQPAAIGTPFPVLLIGAGSFSYKLPTSWGSSVSNQFHIIEIDKRSDSTNFLLGKVLSWAYISRLGWVPSERTCGIEHIYPFGYYPLDQELNELIKPIMIREKNKGKIAISLKELIEEAKLEHVSLASIIMILERLKSKYGFTIRGKEMDIEDLILYGN